MDDARLDVLIRSLMPDGTRRGAMRSLLGGALGLLGLVESVARKKRKGKKKRKRGKKGAKGNACANPGGNDPSGLDTEELVFLTLINDYRQANGRGRLTPNRLLREAADVQSQGLVDCGCYPHNNPCTGLTWQQNIRDHGYTQGKIGENIDCGSATAAQAFAGWRASPGHDENMLWREFKEIGISRMEDGASGIWYWTTTFGGCQG